MHGCRVARVSCLSRAATLALLLAGCEPTAVVDIDAAPGSDSSVRCIEDDDCDNGVFCDGSELCRPGATDADGRGCVRPESARCTRAGETCDEAAQRCTTDCMGGGDPDADGDGRVSVDCGGDDCDDADPDRFPGNVEICDMDAHDEDCNDDTFGFIDADGDGSATRVCCNGPNCGDDCNDADSTINPRAGDACDGIDNDCDGTADVGCDCSPGETVDCGTAAQLARRGICRPGTQVCIEGTLSDRCAGGIAPLEEVCAGDRADEDCDGEIDEHVLRTYYVDADGDGFGTPQVTGDPATTPLVACSVAAGYASNDDDCDDTRASSNPGNPEVCNGADDDCDTRTDEGFLRTYYRDADGDGFGASAMSMTLCSPPDGYVLVGSDCNDTTNTVSPAAVEVCNGADDDCDTRTDEGVLRTYYADADGDGFGVATSPTTACMAPAGHSDRAGDCVDTNAGVTPSASELCNGIDDNCRGGADEGCSCTDGMSRACAGGSDVGECAAGSQLCIGGTWQSCNGQITAVAESCNGRDDDCDTRTDESVTVTGCYADADGDGYGAGLASTQCRDATRMAAGFCPTGYTTTSGDCSDGNATVRPGATETCNARDDNCDGAADNGAGMICVAGTSRSGTGSNPFCGSIPGTFVCSSCTAEVFVAAPPAETCNALDDDCDGSADDAFSCVRGQAGYSCSTACGTVGTRSCSASCTFGGQACTATEVCNGCDDDGDSVADDGFTCRQGETRSCTRMCGAAALTGTQRCLADCGGWSACTLAEVCNGCDDDGDGSVDNGFMCPQSQVTYCTTGCGTAGQRVCNATCSGFVASACTSVVEYCNFCDDDGDFDETAAMTTIDPEDEGVSGLVGFADTDCASWTLGGAASCASSSTALLVDAVSEISAIWSQPLYFGWGPIVVQAAISQQPPASGTIGDGWAILITDVAPGALTGTATRLGMPIRHGVYLMWRYNGTGADTIDIGELSATGTLISRASHTVSAGTPLYPYRMDTLGASASLFTLELSYEATPATASRGRVVLTLIDTGGGRTEVPLSSSELGSGADILSPGSQVWVGVTAATSASTRSTIQAITQVIPFWYNPNLGVVAHDTCESRAP